MINDETRGRRVTEAGECNVLLISTDQCLREPQNCGSSGNNRREVRNPYMYLNGRSGECVWYVNQKVGISRRAGMVLTGIPRRYRDGMEYGNERD